MIIRITIIAIALSLHITPSYAQSSASSNEKAQVDQSLKRVLPHRHWGSHKKIILRANREVICKSGAKIYGELHNSTDYKERVLLLGSFSGETAISLNKKSISRGWISYGLLTANNEQINLNGKPAVVRINNTLYVECFS